MGVITTKSQNMFKEKFLLNCHITGDGLIINLNHWQWIRRWSQLSSIDITTPITHQKFKQRMYFDFSHWKSRIVIGGTAGCRNDNLRCRQWRQSCHHDNSRFSMHTRWWPRFVRTASANGTYLSAWHFARVIIDTTSKWGRVKFQAKWGSVSWPPFSSCKGQTPSLLYTQ